jgi:hypothetical protein
MFVLHRKHMPPQLITGIALLFITLLYWKSRRLFPKYFFLWLSIMAMNWTCKLIDSGVAVGLKWPNRYKEKSCSFEAKAISVASLETVPPLGTISKQDKQSVLLWLWLTVQLETFWNFWELKHGRGPGGDCVQWCLWYEHLCYG